jgi:phosphoribosyl 1,2-cyclic phosphodiesterase
MRLALLGVRGSTPAPGASFVRYGGHTSCVAVLPDGPGPPALLLDAGTGLRDLPGLLGGAPFDGAVVLTHLHWDHVQGLPFCPSMGHPGSRVTVHLPAPAGADAAALLARGMSPPHFPIGRRGCAATGPSPARPTASPCPD